MSNETQPDEKDRDLFERVNAFLYYSKESTNTCMEWVQSNSDLAVNKAVRAERERLLQQLVYFQNTINSRIDASVSKRLNGIDYSDPETLHEWINQEFIELREKIEKGLGSEPKK